MKIKLIENWLRVTGEFEQCVTLLCTFARSKGQSKWEAIRRSSGSRSCLMLQEMGEEKTA